MKTNLDEKTKEIFDEVFNFIEQSKPDWERLIIDGQYKIKTNQETVEFSLVEKILEKFNLKITEVSFTDYYGIVFGIEKIESN